MSDASLHAWHGNESLWSDRVTFVPKPEKVRSLIASHGREAAEERWGRRVVLAVLKAEKHQIRVVAKARARHERRHPEM
ncbi:hypothetical protein [Aureimonas sp. AU40]|uniref:hypothetical protein n=1 Tax=Aureimonas sp. AU40 TaxID=1637747 RepID=UPI000781091F|nr:hypothetical protein [Aureimonas sp. AU40]